MTRSSDGLQRHRGFDSLGQEFFHARIPQRTTQTRQAARVAGQPGLEILAAAKELPIRILRPSLNDALVALAEGVLEVQQPNHQPDRQARATRCARACARHLQGRAKQVQALDRTPLAVPVGKARRQRRFDLGPRHAGRQYGQRVTQIDHCVQPGAEKVRGGHRKPALQIFQKVNAIALETGGFGKVSGALSPRRKRGGRIVQDRLLTVPWSCSAARS